MKLLTMIAPGHVTEINKQDCMETALFYLNTIPNLNRYILINNSKYDVDLFIDDERFICINDKTSFSEIPSVGEANILYNFLKSSNDELFVKVHARCKILNIHHFIQSVDYKNLDDFYCILRKNLIADFFGGYPSRCYIDTRILIFKGSFGSVLYKWVHDRYDSKQSIGMIEHEVFNFLCLKGFKKVSFFSSQPKMVGISGHGRNYNSFKSKIRYLLVQLMLKFGLS